MSNEHVLDRIKADTGLEKDHEIQDLNLVLYLNVLYKNSKLTNNNYNLDCLIEIKRFISNGKSRFVLIPKSEGIFDEIFDFMSDMKELEDIWYDESILPTEEFLEENNIKEDDWIERAEIHFDIHGINNQAHLQSIFISENDILLIDPLYPQNNLDRIRRELELIEGFSKPKIEPIIEYTQEEVEELENLSLEEQ